MNGVIPIPENRLPAIRPVDTPAVPSVFTEGQGIAVAEVIKSASNHFATNIKDMAAMNVGCQIKQAFSVHQDEKSFSMQYVMEFSNAKDVMLSGNTEKRSVWE